MFYFFFTLRIQLSPAGIHGSCGQKAGTGSKAKYCQVIESKLCSEVWARIRAAKADGSDEVTDFADFFIRNL